MPRLRTPRSIDQHVSSFELDGDLVLFEKWAGRLFVLNSTAAWIWRASAAGLTDAELVAELRRTTGIAARTARRDVDALLEDWRAAGLTAPTKGASAKPAHRRTKRATRREPPLLKRLLRGLPPNPGKAYRLLDFSFRVAAEPTEAALIDGLLGHLLAPEADQHAPVLSVLEYGDGFALARGNRLLGQCTRRGELVPLVHGIVLAMAYEASECLAALHAAAVAHGSGCIVMPALSGSGKSTLTAALAARGFAYCCDDLALLTKPPIRLRPMPVRVGLKTGSWRILEEIVPTLGNLPVFRRADGKDVRYLLPPGDFRPDSSANPCDVRAVVFPQYVPGSASALAPIARSDALLRIADAGYDLPGKLGVSVVRSLVEWLAAVPCYELAFDDLDRAVDSMARAFA